jgi:hypothetical protein
MYALSAGNYRRAGGQVGTKVYPVYWLDMKWRKVEMAAKRTRAAVIKALKEQVAITVDDLAILLEVDRKLAYDEVKAGNYDLIKVGRLFRIPTASVRRKLGIPAQK